MDSTTFRVLSVLVILAHRRRSVAHFNVTEHPTAAWVAQQLREAFPDDRAPRYLIRDRDRAYGERFRDRVGEMGITEVLTAPRSPWQNAFAERLIGPIRRECLDHVIVLGEKHLRRILRSYFEYSRNRARTCRWARILPPPAPCNRQRLELLWRLRKLVAYITATNDVLRKGALEYAASPRPRRAACLVEPGLLTSAYRVKN